MASTAVAQPPRQDLDGFDVGILSPMSTNSLVKDFDYDFNMEHIETIPAQVTSPPRVAFVNTNGKRRGSQSSDQKAGLACMNCRPKKIKCQRDGESCRRCLRLKLHCKIPDGDERRRPSSKSHIRDLENKISSLELELKAQKEANLLLSAVTNTDTFLTDADPDFMVTENLIASEEGSTLLDNTTMDFPVVPEHPNAFHDTTFPNFPVTPATSKSTQVLPEKPKSLIARLCTRQSSLNADDIGQLRFFGHTSSLHTVDNTSSLSSFVEWGDFTTREDSLNSDIPYDLQCGLLDLYWKHQHTVLQVIQKEAFLFDMRNNRCRYYSKALLYAIMACGAKISDVPHIRSLAFSKDSGAGTSEPYLLKKAMILVEEELENNPGITTIQALQLLSVCHCARGADTNGWMDTGRAIRLMFELGLHRDPEEMENCNLTSMDLEVRRTVLWGCFTFDRVWSLYLGRPYAIKLEDVTVHAPLYGFDVPSFELLMSDAWVNLLTIVGQISDTLNDSSRKSYQSVFVFNQRLLDWRAQLDPSLKYSSGAEASVSILHMQFCTAMILLHRPNVGFGTQISGSTPDSIKSRGVCVGYTVLMASIVKDYRQHYGSSLTMLSTALYNITMAAIVLIADITDHGSISPDSSHINSIEVMIGALRELEDSYIVARTVLKQLKYLMKRCKLLSLYKEIESRKDMDSVILAGFAGSDPMDSPPQDLSGQSLPPIDQTETEFWGADFLMAMKDCDALHSIGTWGAA